VSSGNKLIECDKEICCTLISSSNNAALAHCNNAQIRKFDVKMLKQQIFGVLLFLEPTWRGGQLEAEASLPRSPIERCGMPQRMQMTVSMFTGPVLVELGSCTVAHRYFGVCYRCPRMN
jgi:hypothetical protein